MAISGLFGLIALGNISTTLYVVFKKWRRKGRLYHNGGAGIAGSRGASPSILGLSSSNPLSNQVSNQSSSHSSIHSSGQLYTHHSHQQHPNQQLLYQTIPRQRRPSPSK